VGSIDCHRGSHRRHQFDDTRGPDVELSAQQWVLNAAFSIGLPGVSSVRGCRKEARKTHHRYAGSRPKAFEHSWPRKAVLGGQTHAAAFATSCTSYMTRLLLTY
jgi:hypothetical protein